MTAPTRIDPYNIAALKFIEETFEIAELTQDKIDELTRDYAAIIRDTFAPYVLTPAPAPAGETEAAMQQIPASEIIDRFLMADELAYQLEQTAIRNHESNKHEGRFKDCPFDSCLRPRQALACFNALKGQ